MCNTAWKWFSIQSDGCHTTAPHTSPPRTKKLHRITCSFPKPTPPKKNTQEPAQKSCFFLTTTPPLFVGLPCSPSHTSSTAGSETTGSTSTSTASRLPLDAVSANWAAKPQGLEAEICFPFFPENRWSKRKWGPRIDGTFWDVIYLLQPRQLWRIEGAVFCKLIFPPLNRGIHHNEFLGVLLWEGWHRKANNSPMKRMCLASLLGETHKPP